MTIDNVSIGRKIKELRQGQNKTGEELAALTGLSQSTISAIESGKHATTLINIIKICGAHNIELPQLLMEKDMSPELAELIYLVKQLSSDEQKNLALFLRSLLSK